MGLYSSVKTEADYFLGTGVMLAVRQQTWKLLCHIEILRMTNNSGAKILLFLKNRGKKIKGI